MLLKSNFFMKIRREHWLLFFILLGGFLLRFWVVGWGLPYLYHSDEWRVVVPYLTMVKTGDLDPEWYVYPALTMYINALVYAVYYFVQLGLGNFHSVDDIAFPDVLIRGSGIIADPNVYYLGRMVSLFFGLGVIFMGYCCAKKISGNSYVGLLAAAFSAVSNASVYQSRFILPNIFVAFFSLVTIWFSLRVLEHGKLKDYLWAGAAVGLTIASKYNGAIVGFVLATAHFSRTGWNGWKDKKFYLSIIVLIFVYQFINIYTLFDFKTFSTQIFVNSNAYITGFAGGKGGTLFWYLNYLWNMEKIASVAALGGILWALGTRSKPAIVASVFPLVYFVSICFFQQRNEQTIMHLLPSLHVMGAYFLGVLIQKGLWLLSRLALPQRLYYFYWVGVAGLVFLSIFLPLRRTITNTQIALRIDSRETARVWINENIPEGSKIAIEAFTPYLDPLKYDITPVVPLLPYTYQWYVDHKIEYLVFGESMFKRYYKEPELYKREIAIYDRLFGLLEPVQFFDDGGYEIRIYRINSH